MSELCCVSFMILYINLIKQLRIHQFKLTTFHRPRHCVHCKSFLKGLKNQGFACNICSAIVHSECASKLVIPCHGHSTTNTHNFAVITLPYIVKCAQCLSVMSSRSGIQCLNCNVIIHEKCKDQFQHPCNKSDVNQTEIISLVDLYASRGLAYYHSSQYDLAIADFNSAIEIDEQRSITSYANRGLAYFYLNRLEDCIKDLTWALDKGIEEIQILNTRASAYQILGFDKEAEADRQRAYQLDNTVVLKVFPYPLPKDIIHLIFSFLTPEEKNQCSLTCKQWNQLISQHLNWRSNIECMNRTITESAENLLTSKYTGGSCDILYMVTAGNILQKDEVRETHSTILFNEVNNPLLSYHSQNIQRGLFCATNMKYLIDTTMQEGIVKRFKSFIFFRAPEIHDHVLVRLSVYPSACADMITPNPKYWKVIEDWFQVTESKKEDNPNQVTTGVTYGPSAVICREEDVLTRYLMIEVRSMRNDVAALDLWQVKAVSVMI